MSTTVGRVQDHTASNVNGKIRLETDERVYRLANNLGAIDDRLRELDKEWDIERVLETNASALAFTGVLLGALVDTRWLVLPALVTAFLFQHAVQGWCPPLPILRRLKFRTSREIDIERNALKALRGDFAFSHDTGGAAKATAALEAARR